MATVKQTARQLTVTLAPVEFFGLVAGHVTGLMKEKLPKYKDRFDNADKVTLTQEGVNFIVQIDAK